MREIQALSPSIALYPSGMIDIPDEYDDGMPYTPKFQEYPAGFIPHRARRYTGQALLRTGVLLDGCNVEIMAVAYLGMRPRRWQRICIGKKCRVDVAM